MPCEANRSLICCRTLGVPNPAHLISSREPGRGPHATSLAAFTPDGQLKWKIAIEGTVRDAPAIAPDGTIFFTTDKGFVCAVTDAGSPPMDSSWPRFQHDPQNSGHSHF